MSILKVIDMQSAWKKSVKQILTTGRSQLTTGQLVTGQFNTGQLAVGKENCSSLKP